MRYKSIILMLLLILIHINISGDDPTPTPEPLDYSAQNPVTSNDQWTLVIKEFDDVEMVLVPAGCFMMGSEDGEPDEQPAYEQCFDEPFWIDRYEVSNSQFNLHNGVAENNSAWEDDDLPRENLTWYEAREFCELRGMRLPTEAEWQYAARGPDNLAFPWGNEFDGSIVNYCDANCVYGEWNDTAYDDGHQLTAPVGSYEKGISWVGAYDMSGNIWEWTNTIYADYPYDATDGREDETDEDVKRVIRGGAWNTPVEVVRSADRDWYRSTHANSEVGFRCAHGYLD